MMQLISDTLVFISLFVLLTFQAVILPRLQIGASMRLPDGSIPWLSAKADIGKSTRGSPTQVALSFSVFSFVWFILHVGSRLVMGLGWISDPVSRSFQADSPAKELVESWFGISFMALFLELALAPYVMIKTLLRNFDPMAVAASIPWALVACYTLWIISPFSVAGG